MTKKEKQYLQAKEAALYLEFVECKDLFGMDDNITRTALGKWSIVSDILDALSVEVDQQLPDNKKAFEIQVGS